MVEVLPEQIWMIVVGFLIAFVLAFGIGANDVANSFGTSVGSKVLTMQQACILASIFETLGAILLGAKVSDTIRKGIIDIEPYTNNTGLLMVGNVAALSGSCVWLLAATLLRLPVSGTHSIVGATVGFALVAHGPKGIKWVKLGMIVGSWFVSPVLAGLVSTALFYFCKFFILSKADALEPGLMFLPVFYAATVIINLFSVFYDGPEMFGFDHIPLYGVFILSFGSGIICAILVRLLVVPWQRNRIKEQCSYASPTKEIVESEQVQFDFKQNAVTYTPNNSEENSRRNSTEKKAVPPTTLTTTDSAATAVTNGNTAVTNGNTLPPSPPGGAANNNIAPLNQANAPQTKPFLNGRKRTMSEGTERKTPPEFTGSGRTREMSESGVERVRRQSESGCVRKPSLSPPIPNVTSHILAEISIPNAKLVQSLKPLINKGEGAALMDNEYKHVDSPTSDKLTTPTTRRK